MRRSSAAALGDRVGPGLPDARIPLPDKSAPILDGQLHGAPAHMEDSLLIALGRGGEHVHLVEVARGQVDCLALCDQCIGLAGSGGSQLEGHAIHVQLGGQHLGRKGVALLVESACRFRVVFAGGGKFVLQCNRLRLNTGNANGRRAELHGKGPRLIGLE